MARLPRLALGGLPHLVVQRGHNGQAVFADDEDRQAFLAALREATQQHQVAVHAYALLDHEVWLVLTPPTPESLSRAMQALGRRYVAGFNHRHGRSGTLWDGRFRATVVDPATHLLPALLFVDTLAVRRGQSEAVAWSSAPHHLGERRDALVSNSGAYWALGNTPFERESAWRRRLEEGLGEAASRQLEQAARKGWALGSESFLAEWSPTSTRPLVARRRGRPPRTPAA